MLFVLLCCLYYYVVCINISFVLLFRLFAGSSVVGYFLFINKLASIISIFRLLFLLLLFYFLFFLFFIVIKLLLLTFISLETYSH